MKIGLVGLGPTAGALAERAAARGHAAAGFDKAGLPRALMGAPIEDAATLEGLAAALAPPRLVFLCDAPGSAADEALLGLRRHLEDGDVVLDATDAHWRDSVRRYRALRARGLRLLDLGLSSAGDGWAVMAGGDLDAFAAASGLLEDLARPGQAAYVGPPGAGHFARAASEALEASLAETLREGLGMLAGCEYRYDVEALLSLWQSGTGLAGGTLARELTRLRGDVEPGGGPSAARLWMIEQALERGQALPLMTLAHVESLRQRGAGVSEGRASGKPRLPRAS